MQVCVYGLGDNRVKKGDLVEHKYKKRIGVIKYRHNWPPLSYRVLWFDNQKEETEWHNVIRVTKTQQRSKNEIDK